MKCYRTNNLKDTAIDRYREAELRVAYSEQQYELAKTRKEQAEARLTWLSTEIEQLSRFVQNHPRKLSGEGEDNGVNARVSEASSKIIGYRKEQKKLQAQLSFHGDIFRNCANLCAAAAAARSDLTTLDIAIRDVKKINESEKYSAKRQEKIDSLETTNRAVSKQLSEQGQVKNFSEGLKTDLRKEVIIPNEFRKNFKSSSVLPDTSYFAGFSSGFFVGSVNNTDDILFQQIREQLSDPQSDKLQRRLRLLCKDIQNEELSIEDKNTLIAMFVSIPGTIKEGLECSVLSVLSDKAENSFSLSMV